MIGKIFKGAIAAILYKNLYMLNERGSVCKLSFDQAILWSCGLYKHLATYGWLEMIVYKFM
jgi:hypothetical protein